MLILIVRDPVSVEIGRASVTIRYPGWRKRIPFSDVAAITLGDEPDARGNVWAAVTVSRRGRQKPVRFYRFREGSLALADALQAARGRAAASSAPTPP
jgi:hypothetical protein